MQHKVKSHSRFISIVVFVVFVCLFVCLFICLFACSLALFLYCHAPSFGLQRMKAGGVRLSLGTMFSAACDQSALEQG